MDFRVFFDVSLLYFGMQELALDDYLHLVSVIRAETAVNGDGLPRMSVNVIFHSTDYC